jgi:hypothetical protein
MKACYTVEPLRTPLPGNPVNKGVKGGLVKGGTTSNSSAAQTDILTAWPDQAESPCASILRTRRPSRCPR